MSSVQRERKLGLLILGCVIAIIIAFSLASCSPITHPSSGSYFVTKNNVCTRENVDIVYKENIFGSKISLEYRDSMDTLLLPRLFRQQDANTFSNGIDTVIVGKGQLLKVNHITVDYRCH